MQSKGTKAQLSLARHLGQLRGGSLNPVPGPSRDISNTSQNARVSIPCPSLIRKPQPSLPFVTAKTVSGSFYDDDEAISSTLEDSIVQDDETDIDVDSDSGDTSDREVEFETPPAAAIPSPSEEAIDSLRSTSISDATYDPIFLAHDRDTVARMNQWDIAWGVQFELARGVTQEYWTWDDITDDRLELLQGSNLEKGPRVIDVMRKGSENLTDNEFRERVKVLTPILSTEMDREHKARLENKGRGLGLLGSWEGVEDWYGGRVQQIAKLRCHGQGFRFTLEPLHLGKSNRVTRFVGSRSVLQVRVELRKDKRSLSQFKNLTDFLSRRHVFCGRGYQAFYSKAEKDNGTVYLVECSDTDYDREPNDREGDKFRISWDDFIGWHNPIDRNLEQPLSKWVSRWQLALSTSVPVLEFEPQNMFFIDDLFAMVDGQQTENMMTDGCGFMNFAAFAKIAAFKKLSLVPCAVQGRIAGAKGLWILHPDAIHQTGGEAPMIWTRSSQNKIKLPPLNAVDRSQRIFDLVRLPHTATPSGLNKQTIVNMNANGVPGEAIIDLLRKGLREEIEPLIAWTQDNARIRLARAVEIAGSLASSRRSRLVGIEARAYGFVRDEADEPDEDTNVKSDGLIDRFEGSGCPEGLHEIARGLLLAGFSPIRLPFLQDKLEYIVKLIAKHYVDQFHIAVPNSIRAFMAPDPYGVLKKDEIFFRSSGIIGESIASMDPHILLGRVLAMRDPTIQGSDEQKVTAVMHPQLLPYKDVVLLSVEGEESLSTKLSGGDCDGDTATLIADPSLVDQFVDPIRVTEPTGLRDNFEREIEKVSEFAKRIGNLLPDARQYELSNKLLLGLKDTKVGLYSVAHENAVYTKGYNHPETVRLGYMFTTCLDANKTGLTVKNDVFEKDTQSSDIRPSYVIKSQEQEPSGRPKTLPRPVEMGPFILDVLRTEGEDLQREVLSQYKEMCEEASGDLDLDESDLCEPYDSAVNKAEQDEKDANAVLWSSVAALKTAERNAKDVVEPSSSDVLHQLELLRWDVRDAKKAVASAAIILEQQRKMRWHVQDVFDEFYKALGRRDKGKNARNNNSSGKQAAPRTRHALVQELIDKFRAGPLENGKRVKYPPEYMKIMASYAYKLSVAKKLNTLTMREFPFDVAYKELCLIKAEKLGIVSMSEDAADYLLIHSSLVKSL